MLSPHDINSKQFTAVRLREGYAQDEVDEFLDDVAEQLQVTLTRLAKVEQELSAYKRAGDERPTAIIPVVKPSASVEGILKLAQEVADKHVAEAQSNGANLLADARAEAARLKNEAAATALDLKSEAVAVAQKVKDEATIEAERLRTEGVAEKQRLLDDLEARHGQVAAAVDRLSTEGAKVRQAIAQALTQYEEGVT